MILGIYELVYMVNLFKEIMVSWEFPYVITLFSIYNELYKYGWVFFAGNSFECAC